MLVLATCCLTLRGGGGGLGLGSVHLERHNLREAETKANEIIYNRSIQASNLVLCTKSGHNINIIWVNNRSPCNVQRNLDLHEDRHLLRNCNLLGGQLLQLL